MTSLRTHEGYFLMDHTNSPGVPDELLVKEGLPPGFGQKKFESATFTCSHCEAVVVMNPDRQRSRGYCRKCDHLVCDGCEAARVASGGECYPYKARIYDLIDAAIAAPVGSETFSSSIIIP